MEIGITMAPSYILTNRDGLTPVRLVQCMVADLTDRRTIQLVGNIDDAPVVGSKILILPVESAWECGITLESILPDVLTMIGDKTIGASIAIGVVDPLAKLRFQAATHEAVFGDGTGYATEFLDMKIAFEALKTQIAAMCTVFGTHTHSGVTTGTGSTGTPSAAMVAPTADMTAAQCLFVRLP
jgi:hypothetical protein